jgi:hypothetical protein
MTNFDRWRLWNKNSFSPDMFIEWGFYSLIGAALQRRIWYDNDEYPLYPNLYTCFVGPAGVGKGLQMTQVRRFLDACVTDGLSESQIALNDSAGKSMDNQMFPLAADSTTFESFLVETKASHRIFTAGENKYHHASLFFILDELVSIFKKNSEDIINYLLTAWTCSPYTRKTKNNGHFHLTAPCVNILAGTTPDSLLSISRKEIIGTGFSSRWIMVYGFKNRIDDIKMPRPDDEQQKAKVELLAWLRKLAKVFGVCKVSKEGEDLLRAYFRDKEKFIVNRNPRLAEYYARKLQNVQKIIMIMHYSEEGFGAEVPAATVARAIDAFNRVEVDMHLALQGGGRNELSPIGIKITHYIKTRPDGVPFKEIWIHFGDDARGDELKEILIALQAQNLVVYRDDRYFSSGK